MPLQIECIPSPPLETNVYLVADPHLKKALVIDPSFAFPLIQERFMGGRLVPLTIAGVNVEIVQLREHRQFVGQTRPQAADHQLIEFLEELEAPRAPEGMEVMAPFGALLPAMGLEETPAGGRFVQGALEAQGDPSRVGEFRAHPLGGTGGDEGQRGVREIFVNRGQYSI